MEDRFELDVQWMHVALLEAAEASKFAEVPVGCVIVDPAGRPIGRAHNKRESLADPTAHAEILALREASAKLLTWRLDASTAYVTLEPCAMCAGALLNARIGRLVYGCPDPKSGAVDTMFGIGRDSRLNHRFDVTSGVLADESVTLLQDFFRRRRT